MVVNKINTTGGMSQIPHTRRMFFRKMSDFPQTEVLQNGNCSNGGVTPPDMTAVLENFQKKSLSQSPVNMTTITSGRPSIGSGNASTQLTNASQLLSNSSSSRVAKASSSLSTSSSSQRVHHHHVTSELKASSMKSDIAELKSSISEMKTLSELNQATTCTTTSKASTCNTSSSSTASMLQHNLSRLRSSMDNLVDCNDSTNDDCSDNEVHDSNEPLVTFPDTPDTCIIRSNGSPSINGSGSTTPVSPLSGVCLTTCTSPNGMLANGSESMKFEQKRMHSASKTKVVTDSYSSEKATANCAELKRIQTGDVSYQEKSSAAALRARLDMDGMTAEKNLARTKEQRSLKTGEMTQQDTHNMSAASMRLQGDHFSAEKKAMLSQQQRQTVTSSSMINSEKHFATSSQSNITITKGMCTKSSMMSQTNVNEEEFLRLEFDDLDKLSSNSNQQEVEKVIHKYTAYVDNFIKMLQKETDSMTVGQNGGVPMITNGGLLSKRAPDILNKINDIVRKSWAVPKHGHELGTSLCNSLRISGGLDLLMSNCIMQDDKLRFFSAQLLEQCLTTENRAYVIENGLDKVVSVACSCTKPVKKELECIVKPTVYSRVGTGILEHLFKHSEGTCSDVIRLGGLDAVLFECRKNDIETLRHCASALANLSLYGGNENQEAMIKRNVPMWLFPLAFHFDDNIKYYACLAIAVLVANKEIEAAVLQSGTLDLVEPFVTTHNPSEFAKSNLSHAHGQSKHWLQRLVPVLSSMREEARNLAAFHFCMEAGIKKQQNKTDIFLEIGAIEPLKKVASCPNAVASRYAAQALRLIGEEVPHKLSQQVPLWSIEDVREWVKQIGFTEYAANFVESRVDGDLLLQLTEDNLKHDIGLTNGIRRQRFTRELQNLKKMADYSSRDTDNLNQFLQSIAQEFSIYTYSMLNAGVDKHSIQSLTEDQLQNECGITNSIHRLRILDLIQQGSEVGTFGGTYFNREARDDRLDVFISYRRQNGSQLASLLKVFLNLRGFSVFIDVERLEAGKFDNNLLRSIQKSKNFLLVLTPNALDRCIKDYECKDWVHKEIKAALQAQCRIIPVFDQFSPDNFPEELPDAIKSIKTFNGIQWVHDYQEACINKLEKWLRGESDSSDDLESLLDMGSQTGKNDTLRTPNILPRTMPNYQRMHSSDSNKSSDKDMSGSGGGASNGGTD